MHTKRANTLRSGIINQNYECSILPYQCITQHQAEQTTKYSLYLQKGTQIIGSAKNINVQKGFKYHFSQDIQNNIINITRLKGRQIIVYWRLYEHKFVYQDQNQNDPKQIEILKHQAKIDLKQVWSSHHLGGQGDKKQWKLYFNKRKLQFGCYILFCTDAITLNMLKKQIASKKFILCSPRKTIILKSLENQSPISLKENPQYQVNKNKDKQFEVFSNLQNESERKVMVRSTEDKPMKNQKLLNDLLPGVQYCEEHSNFENFHNMRKAHSVQDKPIHFFHEAEDILKSPLKGQLNINHKKKRKFSKMNKKPASIVSWLIIFSLVFSIIFGIGFAIVQSNKKLSKE